MFAFTNDDAKETDATIAKYLLVISVPPFVNFVRTVRTRLLYLVICILSRGNFRYKFKIVRIFKIKTKELRIYAKTNNQTVYKKL